MKKLDSLVVEGISYALICIFSIGLYSLGSNLLEREKWERTRREVAFSIDDNKDRLYTDNEWSKVYQSLRINDTRKQGTDLTTKQLRDYLIRKNKILESSETIR